jgi:hypothetical protein
MLLYRIICWIRGEHNFEREVIIDENTTKNYCKCGKWLGFGWSFVGGHKRGISELENMKRTFRWNS